MPGSTNFEKLLNKATSNQLTIPDWTTTLKICDLIKQNHVRPKVALASIKNKLLSPNSRTSYCALLVLESVVKNCGVPVHDELNKKAYCDFLRALSETTTHDDVRKKLLELILTWSFAFRKNPKYEHIKAIFRAMRAEGKPFGILRESEAMFTPDAFEEDECNRCYEPFAELEITTKHPCRVCKHSFCKDCIEMGWEDDMCEECCLNEAGESYFAEWEAKQRDSHSDSNNVPVLRVGLIRVSSTQQLQENNLTNSGPKPESKDAPKKAPLDTLVNSSQTSSHQPEEGLPGSVQTGEVAAASDQSPNESDAPDLFCQYLGNKLRNYDKRTSDMVQYYISTIIYHADMGNDIEIKAISQQQNMLNTCD